jgi:hypothetical protein
MKRRIVLVALVALLAVLSVGAANADELQFGGGVVGLTGVTGGVNLSLNPFQVQFSDSDTDTAIGSVVSFGSTQPVAFFGTTTGSSEAGSILTAPQVFSISGSGGTLTGNIQAITLSSTNPGVFGLNVTVSPVSLSDGASSLVLNDIYNHSGAATISFQFSSSQYQTLAGLTSVATGSTIRSTASGSIAAVPEPASMMMLGSGVLALLGFSTRRKLLA